MDKELTLNERLVIAAIKGHFTVDDICGSDVVHYHIYGNRKKYFEVEFRTYREILYKITNPDTFFEQEHMRYMKAREADLFKTGKMIVSTLEEFERNLMIGYRSAIATSIVLHKGETLINLDFTPEEVQTMKNNCFKFKLDKDDV
jgi:hypothetical protein